MDSLDEVAHAVHNCFDCPLHRGRTNAVPGEGSPSAELMFIGEGPGFHEDRQGRPFVGPAGQLLEGLLASIGTNREDVFIANMVKCRPPDNRDPEPAEIAACGKYLERQIELINPKLIVTLGRFSLGRFFPGESVTRARGKLRQKDGRNIFPVLHPAAALRRPELRKTLVEDFRAIADILEGDALPEPPPEPDAGPPKEPPAEQMGIFGVPSTPPPSNSFPLEGEGRDGGEAREPADAPAPDAPGRDDGPQQLSLL